MREAGQIVARTHQVLKEHIKPGITTLELDRIAEEYIRSQGATPSFKGLDRCLQDRTRGGEATSLWALGLRSKL